MVRTRFEVLEKRQMFAASTLEGADEAYVLMHCSNDLLARPDELIGSETAGDAAGLPQARIDVSPTYDSDLALQIVGDFNGDGVDELASFTGRQGFLLPYIEQDNLYKDQAGDGPQEGCAAAFVAMLDRDSLGRKPEPSRSGSIADVADGSSNTIMFRAASDDDRAGSRSLVDIWEHAYSEQTGANTNGIIAILIGLTTDPSDPSGNTAQGNNFAFGDGSVRFLRVDNSGIG